jgi:hypothetical protein
MGVVNLFADVTYEGGASINGQFLGSLGASAAAVSIIAGAGECLGYVLRSVAGYLADKTGKYWPITFMGYAIGGWVMPYFDQEFGEEVDRLFSEKFDLLLGGQDLRDFRGVLAVPRRT